MVAKQADIVLHYSRPLAPTVGETEQMKLHFKHYHLRRLGPSLSGNTYNEKLFIVLLYFFTLAYTVYIALLANSSQVNS